MILIGDALNMRHPLTGGGMTVALKDVVLLTQILSPFLQAPSTSFEDSCPAASYTMAVDWDELREALREWHWSRKTFATSINILSVALYDLFGASDVDLDVLRDGCFAYFERGGDCILGPVSLLSGLAPSPLLLARHFFAVALYAIYIYWQKPQFVPIEGRSKIALRQPTPLHYPAMLIRSLSVFWKAVVVFGPLVWTEIRWW